MVCTLFDMFGLAVAHPSSGTYRLRSEIIPGGAKKPSIGRAKDDTNFTGRTFANPLYCRIEPEFNSLSLQTVSQSLGDFCVFMAQDLCTSFKDRDLAPEAMHHLSKLEANVSGSKNEPPFPPPRTTASYVSGSFIWLLYLCCCPSSPYFHNLIVRLNLGGSPVRSNHRRYGGH
jgi:hypothetical protein